MKHISILHCITFFLTYLSLHSSLCLHLPHWNLFLRLLFWRLSLRCCFRGGFRGFLSNLFVNGRLNVRFRLNVRLNLLHQRRNGDELSAQCLGFQDAFQLLGLVAVDARVLRRWGWWGVGLVRSSHPHGFGFGVAAFDFPVDCVQECELVFVDRAGSKLCLHGALHGAQLINCGRRENFNGNLHFQPRIGILMLVVPGPLGPLGVRGWTVSGVGILGKGI